jgi:uncharacterized protein with PQ loop repeat
MADDNQLVLDILGYTGAVLLALLNMPQVYYCYKNKTTKGLSTAFIILAVATSTCFTAYGILLPSAHLIIANSMSLVGCVMLLVAKVLFKDGKQGNVATV